MTRTTPDPLYMMAYDHRQVLRDLYGQAAEGRFTETKLVALDVLDRVAAAGVPRAALGFLVDEEYGAPAARTARQRDIYLAMPIEASRTKIFELQYPADYAERFAGFQPECVKALVFHNPADDDARKEVQFTRIAEVATWAHRHGHDFLLEVLVTPTAAQLAGCGEDTAAFRREALPGLLVESIAEYQARGIEPDIWKIEGLDTVEACEAVGAQATVGGRGQVRCIVLGSGASLQTVGTWLRAAARVPAFAGFAVGRSVWHRPLGDLLAGTATRDEAVDRMVAAFTGLIDAFGRTDLEMTLRA
ncbi:2-deoxy-5-keto-D-gluconate 6-phosphate aldolase domain-containing protein [Phytohabitans kaempferiae]|uniref:2-deoxy-5-keto-D-gluconate 6-phosphate aldolase domain-containing protein n=1 Tax=Phytohabitans kaempferiae TaxID=1620943 RepID=A0ABV6MAD7_9ACTN